MTNHEHDRAIDTHYPARCRRHRGYAILPGWSRTWRSAPNVRNMPRLVESTGQLLRSVAITASPALVATTQARVRARAS